MGLFFLVLLTITCVMAVIWENLEIRLAVATLCADFILTALAFKQTSRNWLDWPLTIFVIDLTAFSVLLVLALRSKRFWPLPIAALQALPVMMPLVQLVGKNLVSDALGRTQGIWAYFQLAILTAVAWRMRKSRDFPKTN